jgi:hypothetical protein
MDWKQPTKIKDSRQQMAHMVETPGFTLPLNPDGEPATCSNLSRLLQGPFIMDGDLCDVLPGDEAVVLVSPSGEKMIMQNEGRATFHVPSGWRLMVGSLPLRARQRVQRLVRVGDSIEEVESSQTVLRVENITDLYQEAEATNISKAL